MQKQPSYKPKPHVLGFMRRSSGMTEEEVAKKLKLSLDRYRQIESGNAPLSQRRLLHLADLYKRPLAAFFAINPEQNIELPHDYRLNRDRKISPEIFLAKRKALYLAGELCAITDRKTELPSLAPNLSPTELAGRARALLGIDDKRVQQIATEKLKNETVLSYYVRLIEDKCFLPVLEQPLKSSGVRAFSVHSDISVIVLNESDPNEVKLFSLFHEFCHLLKKQDGICAADIERDSEPEERYCDKFAADLLLPEDLVIAEAQTPISDSKQVSALAQKFGVSKSVMLIRLKELGRISPSQHDAIKAELESHRQRSFGRRNWEQTFVKRTGRLVLKCLIDAYKKGDLTYASLAATTGIKDKYLQKLIE